MVVYMLGQIDGGYRPQVKVSDNQFNCLHEWHHNEVILLPQPTVCSCCKRATMQRARIHCPLCLITACNLCGPYYFNKAVPVAPARSAPFFPKNLIKEQQYYISWCEGEIKRLQKEVDYYKSQYETLLLEKDLQAEFIELDKGKEPEQAVSAENLINNIVETVSNAIQHQKANPEEQNKTSVRAKRLFGRQNTIHKIFGGGQSADMLLWRNTKISSTILTCATVIWVLFEWLNYHFLTLLPFMLFVGMLGQFAWSNVSVVLNRSTTHVPRVVIPEDIFVNIATSLGTQINQFLGYVQDVACERNLRQFLVVAAGLWAAAIIGTWCNFLTVIYAGLVCAHTLPVVYEKYEDEMDDFLYNFFGQVQNHYSKLNMSVLSKLSRGNFKPKKNE